MSKPIGWSKKNEEALSQELEDGKQLWKCDEDAVDVLESEIKRLEYSLNAKQVKFAQIFATGQFNSRQTAIQAGYSPTSAHTRSWELLKSENVKRLIQCYRDVDSLKNGLPLSWKRSKLVEITNDTTAPHSSRIAAVRLLCELDGNLKSEVGEGATIVVNLDLGARAGHTFENGHNPLALRNGGEQRHKPLNEL